MLVIQLSGIIALITSIIGLLPQIIKAIRTRSTADLSMLMLLNYLVCSIAWMIYGVGTHTHFVFWSNILGAMSCFVLVLLKQYYDPKNYD